MARWRLLVNAAVIVRNMNKNNIIRALSLTGFVFGLLGWIYIALVALIHPVTLSIQLTHLTPWIREDTFGIICFIVSAISFFIYEVMPDGENH